MPLPTSAPCKDGQPSAGCEGHRPQTGEPVEDTIAGHQWRPALPTDRPSLVVLERARRTQPGQGLLPSVPQPPALPGGCPRTGRADGRVGWRDFRAGPDHRFQKTGRPRDETRPTPERHDRRWTPASTIRPRQRRAALWCLRHRPEDVSPGIEPDQMARSRGGRRVPPGAGHGPTTGRGSGRSRGRSHCRREPFGFEPRKGKSPGPGPCHHVGGQATSPGRKASPTWPQAHGSPQAGPGWRCRRPTQPSPACSGAAASCAPSTSAAASARAGSLFASSATARNGGVNQGSW